MECDKRPSVSRIVIEELKFIHEIICDVQIPQNESQALLISYEAQIYASRKRISKPVEPIIAGPDKFYP